MKKLVLKPTSGEEDVRLIAMIHDWELRRDIPADPTTPRQLLWVLPDGETSLTYVEDTLLQSRYLMPAGPAEAEAEQRIRAGLEVYDPSDLRRLLLPDLDASEALRLIAAAALMAPDDFDQEHFDLFAQALRHPEADVRRAAVFAITYVPWRQFRDLLADLPSRDPAVATDAQVVLSSIDEHGWR